MNSPIFIDTTGAYLVCMVAKCLAHDHMRLVHTVYNKYLSSNFFKFLTKLNTRQKFCVQVLQAVLEFEAHVDDTDLVH